MRFDQIQIPAFGPFTDFSLGFPSSENDLHLIYGRNERGKSSLLRSIDHLLFGIPPRTSDNFIHANPKLRIGASINAPNLAPLSFQRKKGNANTLLDANGNTLPETAIKAFLGPVDRSFFSSMFGLNTESLRDGAHALIAGEGELGAALFSASLGNTDIDAAIDKLESEANSLFKGRARAKIPTAINAFKECEKGIREASIKVTAWKSHQKDLLAAQADYDQTDRLQKVSDQRRLTLQRFLNAQPLTSRLAEAERRLAELAHIPELPTDFAKRVRDAQEQAHQQKQTLTERRNQLEGFEKQLADLQTAPTILARAADIEQLHQSINSHSTRAEELPNLLADAEATTIHLAQVIDQLGIDTDALTRLPPITNLLIDEVSALTTAIHEQTRIEANAQTSLKRLEKDLTTLNEELTAAPALDTSASLKAMRAQARNTLTASEEKDQLAAELEKLTRSSRNLTAQLGLADAESILHLSPPSIDVIHEEKTNCEALINRIIQQRDDLSEVNTRLVDESAQLEVLRKKGARYNQDDLISKRQERDQLLITVLNARNEGSTRIPALGQELSASVQSADSIADSLHQHAEQIALAEKHAHTMSTLKRKQEILQATLEASQADLTHWQAAWDKRCQSIPAQFRKPNDALAWSKTLEQLCVELRNCQSIREKISNISADIEKKHQTLATALDKPDTELATLAVIIEGRLEAISEASGTRKALVKQQGELKEKISSGTEELEAAQTTRKSHEARLTPLQAPFPGAIDALQRAQELQTKQAELELRIVAEETSIAEMSQRIVSLAREVIPEVDATDPGTLVQHLWRQLTSAKEADSQSQVLLKGVANTQTQLATTQAALDAEISKLEELQTLCHATDAASLEATLSGLEKRSGLTKSIEDTHDHLTKMCAGQTLADFIKAATERAEDEMRREMANIESILPEHQVARDAAREHLNALKTEDQKLQQASDLAAAHQQQGQLHLSEIVTDFRRFIELQHAIQFLRQQIELYREKTQGPMIQSTSAYFTALTNGAFDKVAAQLNDKGVPQLIGVRTDGSFVPTTAMSEGTADQLYLALRFAAIDLHLAAHPAMPLILDDLLITFDDERTSALLPILATLSQKTQILVFTHHQHLLDLFSNILPDKHTAQRI